MSALENILEGLLLAGLRQCRLQFDRRIPDTQFDHWAPSCRNWNVTPRRVVAANCLSSYCNHLPDSLHGCHWGKKPERHIRAQRVRRYFLTNSLSRPGKTGFAPACRTLRRFPEMNRELAECGIRLRLAEAKGPLQEHPMRAVLQSTLFGSVFSIDQQALKAARPSRLTIDRYAAQASPGACPALPARQRSGRRRR